MITGGHSPTVIVGLLTPPPPKPNSTKSTPRKKLRHLDRRRRILPPQRRDPRISLLPLPLSLPLLLLLHLHIGTQRIQPWVSLPSEGHGFSRAKKRRAEGATALPKAGVEA